MSRWKILTTTVCTPVARLHFDSRTGWPIFVDLPLDVEGDRAGLGERQGHVSFSSVLRVVLVLHLLGERGACQHLLLRFRWLSRSWQFAIGLNLQIYDTQGFRLVYIGCICTIPGLRINMSEFLFAANTSEIDDGQKVLVEVDQRLVILFRQGESFFCVDDICTHDGGSLFDGELDGFEISCPRHGAKFDIRDGKALCMPATQPTQSHEVKVDGDQILVKIAI